MLDFLTLLRENPYPGAPGRGRRGGCAANVYLVQSVV